MKSSVATTYPIEKASFRGIITEDQVLGQWRQAELAHAKADYRGLPEAFIAKIPPEDAAFARVGRR